MDHVVYLDTQAKELDLLLSGHKRMLVRGAAGRKMPYGRVNPTDILYFINNDASGVIRACSRVMEVVNSDKLSPAESAALLESHQPDLQLTAQQFQRWAGKRYLVLISVEETETLEPFAIDRSAYGNMDDWLLVGKIASVRRE